jgi:hypothetical protein
VNDVVFAGAEPWQMWGNTQELVAPPNAFTNPNAADKQVTLCRVTYGRPDTFRFLVSAFLKSAPATAPGEQANASVWFELMTGIGRSSIILPFWIQLGSWQWNGGAPVPTGRGGQIWTNQAATGTPVFSVDDQTPQVSWISTSYTDQIVGQDMTLVAHATFTTDIANVTEPAIFEVSGQFAPNTHVRPDWMQIDAGPREQFAGGEIKGR